MKGFIVSSLVVTSATCVAWLSWYLVTNLKIVLEEGKLAAAGIQDASAEGAAAATKAQQTLKKINDILP